MSRLLDKTIVLRDLPRAAGARPGRRRPGLVAVRGRDALDAWARWCRSACAPSWRWHFCTCGAFVSGAGAYLPLAAYDVTRPWEGTRGRWRRAPSVAAGARSGLRLRGRGRCHGAASPSVLRRGLPALGPRDPGGAGGRVQPPDQGRPAGPRVGACRQEPRPHGPPGVRGRACHPCRAGAHCPRDPRQRGPPPHARDAAGGGPARGARRRAARPGRLCRRGGHAGRGPGHREGERPRAAGRLRRPQRADAQGGGRRDGLPRPLRSSSTCAATACRQTPAPACWRSRARRSPTCCGMPRPRAWC